ncbi:MAG: glycosyltransferase [Rubrivivax sp.]
MISRTIEQDVARAHGRRGIRIANGLTAPDGEPADPQALGAFDLTPRRYVLLVSRLVPEKRHLDLIQAFARARPHLPGWRLALVGAADHADPYAAQVRAAAAAQPDVVCTGFQSGATLQALYAHAGLFVLPSSHEGLPIALLEALGHGLPVLASDISPHLEMGLPEGACFPLGDVEALAARLVALATGTQHETADARAARAAQALHRHSWDDNVRQTLQVYLRGVGAEAPAHGPMATD